MKQVSNFRAVASTSLAALLFIELSFFGVGAPTSAENEAMPPTPAEHAAEAISSTGDDPYASPDLLKNEAESMNKFGLLFADYLKQFEAVTDSKNPDPSRIAALESKLRDLRSRLPKFQSDARSFAAKLKGAGKWTKELDDYFEAAATRKGAPRESVEFVRKNGGARSLIEKGISSSAHLSAALDQDEKDLAELKGRKVSVLERIESLVVQSAHAGFSLSRAGNCAGCLTQGVSLIASVIGLIAGASQFYQTCRGSCQ